jgi:hypothetical protein
MYVLAENVADQFFLVVNAKRCIMALLAVQNNLAKQRPHSAPPCEPPKEVISSRVM